ncbi:Scr1 family TA system antitoxin-like transcriptional regulator [Streptomyces sp. NPDC004311]|uniref:Scr1 family TA system antitoxin-like transcriptional regulator n=1 Tax=Streptomyces sp. NPDC004311 TaxID=3364698 RepID=UPI0036785AAC
MSKREEDGVHAIASVVQPPPGSPPPSPMAVVLGAYLRHLRLQAGVSAQRAGRHLDRSTSTVTRGERAEVPLRERDVIALLKLYGRGAREDLEDVRDFMRRPEGTGRLPDNGPYQYQRVEAVEALASGITVMSVGSVPPVLRAPAFAAAIVEDTGLVGAPTRPLPEARIELFMEESVLERGWGGPAVMAAQLTYFARLTESGVISCRLHPVEVNPITPRGIVSELVLTTGQRLLMEESAGSPSYRTPPFPAWVGAAGNYMDAVALSPADSLTALKVAAERNVEKAAADGGAR